MKKVVLIGAGTGQAQILKGIKDLPVKITSIVGVTDNGGHSGYLRKVFKIPQVGDTRNCLSALVDDPSLLRRIDHGPLEGTQIGNLIISALTVSTGKLSKAIRGFCEWYGIKQRVLPVSDSSSQVCAVLENGQVIEGEWQIMRRKNRARIVRVFHKPLLQAIKPAIEAIRDADWIILPPGSLFTGLGSVLAAKGVRKAILSSKARVLCLMNIMTQRGQTENLTMKDHLELISGFLGKRPDVVVVNNKRPDGALVKEYAKFRSMQIVDDLGNNDSIIRKPLVAKSSVKRGKKYSSLPHSIVHDAIKTADLIQSILRV